MEDCLVTPKNIGPGKCISLPGQPRFMITTPRNFSLTLEEAASITAWQAALLASPSSRIYLWPNFFSSKPNDEKTSYEESTLGTQFVKRGRKKYEIEIVQSLCLHKAMYSHSSISQQRVFIGDTNDNVFGTINSDGEFCGFDSEMLDVDNLTTNDGKVTSKTPIYLVLANANEQNINGHMVSLAAFRPSLLPLTDVDLAQVGEATDSLIKISVKVSCDGTNVEGLEAADFDVLDSSGDPIVHTVSYANGVYSLASATLFADDDTVTLVAAASLSVPGYEATNTVIVVVT